VASSPEDRRSSDLMIVGRVVEITKVETTPVSQITDREA
jgi:hypothetical protein